jgi:hypothetical protein
MKCREVQQFFDRMYREGDLSENKEIIAHVTDCKQCSRDYAQWCHIADTFGNTPKLDAPPAFYNRVMSAIDAQKKPDKKWSWFPLWQWHPVPATVFAVIVFLLIGTTITLRQQSIHKQISFKRVVQPPGKQDIVLTHFEIDVAAAHRVALVGDFNNWDTKKHQLIKKNDRTWTIDVALPKGCYQYLFYIDDSDWHIDPNGKQKVPDGFGGYNTVIEL